MKYTISGILCILTAAAIVLNACSKKDDPAPDAVNAEDQELYQAALVTSGSAWYKLDPAVLDKAVGSGHDDPKLRTRYNSKAAEKLDVTGKVIAGSVFDENSAIIKELYDASGKLVRYAVMCKAPGSANTDAYGWVWGVYSPTGDVQHSVTLKGVGCTGCHKNLAGNIDLSTMNVTHP